jgi:predicted ABC-type ATPase
MNETHPALWLIAGPNGAGKTTYAFKHVHRVSGSVHFVNLDEIARGLSPLDPQAARLRAARVALAMQEDFIRQRASFSLETTLSGLTYLGLVRRAKEAGFRVFLQFFSVPRVEVSIARVARRVARGGHDVPEPDIRRRYLRAYANFPLYAAALDEWIVWENGGRSAVPVAAGARGCRVPAAQDDARMMRRYTQLPSAFRAELEAMPFF